MQLADSRHLALRLRRLSHKLIHARQPIVSTWLSRIQIRCLLQRSQCFVVLLLLPENDPQPSLVHGRRCGHASFENSRANKVIRQDGRKCIRSLVARGRFWPKKGRRRIPRPPARRAVCLIGLNLNFVSRDFLVILLA